MMVARGGRFDVRNNRDATAGGILFRGRYSVQARRDGRVLLRGRYSGQCTGRILLGRGRYSGGGRVVPLAGGGSAQHTVLRILLLGRDPDERAAAGGRWRWWRVRLLRGRYSVQTRRGGVLLCGRYSRDTRVLFHRDGSGEGTAGAGGVRRRGVLFGGRYPGEGAQITRRAARRHHRGAGEGHRASLRVVAWRPFKRYWKIEGCKVK